MVESARGCGFGPLAGSHTKDCNDTEHQRLGVGGELQYGEQISRAKVCDNEWDLNLLTLFAVNGAEARQLHPSGSPRHVCFVCFL